MGQNAGLFFWKGQKPIFSLDSILMFAWHFKKISFLMDHILVCANLSKSMFLDRFSSFQICIFLSLIQSSTCQWMVWINNGWQDELQVSVRGCFESDGFSWQPLSFSSEEKGASWPVADSFIVNPDKKKIYIYIYTHTHVRAARARHMFTVEKNLWLRSILDFICITK